MLPWVRVLPDVFLAAFNTGQMDLTLLPQSLLNL